MTKFNKQIKINASNEEVWKVISNLGDVYKFHPGVLNSYYSSDDKAGIGAARICELRPMGVIEETATKWDEGHGFTLRIDPIEKAPPVKNFFASLEITDDNSGYVTVVLSAQYDMKLGVVGKLLNAIMIRSQMEKALQGVMEGLKVYVEKGIEIVDGKTLSSFAKVA